MTTSINEGKRRGNMKKLIILATLLAAIASQGYVTRWGGTDLGGTIDYADTNSWFDVYFPTTPLLKVPDGTDSHALIGGNLSDSNNNPVVSTDIGSDHPAIIGVGWDTPWGELLIATGGVMNVNADMYVGWGEWATATGQVTVAGGQIVVGNLHLGFGGDNRGIVHVTDGWLHAGAIEIREGARVEMGTNGLVFVNGDQTVTGLIGSFYAIDDGYSVQQSFTNDVTTFSTFETLAAVAPGPVWQDPVSAADAVVAQDYVATLVGKAIDANGDAITFSKVDGPPWLNVAPSGALTGFPTSADLGTNTFTVSARDDSDDLGNPYETTLTIVVTNPNGLQISVNFNYLTTLPFAGGNAIGPLNSDSSHWNESYLLGEPLASGTLASGLVDSSGVATTAGITYSADAVNYEGGQDATDQSRIHYGFLDPNDAGLSITVSNIPYASYTVYGLVGGDPTGTNDPMADNGDDPMTGWAQPMKSLDFQVNGTWVYGGATPGAAADVYTAIHTSATLSGVVWAEIVPGSVTGMYWSVLSSGSTLTIQGQAGIDVLTRGALAGIIIQEHIPAGPVQDLVIGNSVAGIVLSWTGEAGMPYGVDTNVNLVIPNWGRWATGLINPAGGVISVTNAVGADETFYRVISE